jgi:hypothetical protein
MDTPVTILRDRVKRGIIVSSGGEPWGNVMESTVKPPAIFWIVGVLLLAWNLVGIAAYVMQSGADLNALARTDPVTARAFAEMPQWAWMVYALGVASGAVGALVQLLRRRTAIALFILSLIAVIVQFARTFFATDLLAAKGATVVIFPLVIIAIALFSVWWARRAYRLGWLR